MFLLSFLPLSPLSPLAPSLPSRPGIPLCPGSPGIPGCPFTQPEFLSGTLCSAALINRKSIQICLRKSMFLSNTCAARVQERSLLFEEAQNTECAQRSEDFSDFANLLFHWSECRCLDYLFYHVTHHLCPLL